MCIVVVCGLGIPFIKVTAQYSQDSSLMGIDDLLISLKLLELFSPQLRGRGKNVCERKQILRERLRS